MSDAMSTAVRRRRLAGWQRWALSLLASAWLVAQVLSAIGLDKDMWPLLPMTMFVEGRQEHVDLYLEGAKGDGRRVLLEPAAFGLEPHQLWAWLAARIDPTDESGRAALGQLAAIWNRQHPGDEVVALVLWQQRSSVPEGHPVRTAIVLDWSAP